MLAKKYRLKQEKDFKRVYRKGRYFFTRDFNIKHFSNEKKYSRFAFVVSGKIAKKAVVRNKVRRQLSEIIRNNFSNIKKGEDIILLAKKPLISKSYQDKEKIIIAAFKKTKLWQKSGKK